MDERKGGSLETKTHRQIPRNRYGIWKDKVGIFLYLS